MMKTESKSTINRDAILVQRMILRTNSAPADQSVTDKQTPYFRTHTAGARITIFSKLCMVIEDVERIIKGFLTIIFRSHAYFYLEGARKN